MAKRDAGKRSPGESTHPVYVLCGQDDFLIRDSLHEITRRVLDGADAQLGVCSFDGRSAELAEVLDELRTLPFLTPRRLVVVESADEFVRTYRRQLEEYLARPAATGVLVLVVRSFPRNTRLHRLVSKAGQVVSCEHKAVREIPMWIRRRASVHGKPIKPAAAALLFELVGEDLGRLDSELQKLAVYAAEKDAIEPQDVETLIGHNRVYTIFALTDAISQGDVAGALERLDLLLRLDRSAEYSAIATLAWLYRRLWRAKAMLEQGLLPAQVCRQLRVWYNGQRFITLAQSFSSQRLQQAMNALLLADLAVKSGQGAVQRQIEKFIVRFCGN